MRTQLLTLMVLLPTIGVVNSWWFAGELRRFLDQTSTLSSTIDLERFKQVVARQMYAALVQIFVLGSPLLLFFFGIYRGDIHPTDLLWIVVPSLVVMVLGFMYKGLESKVKGIPTGSDELARQRDAIVSTWNSKPFPDW